jgi:hypothetical protein
MLLLLAVTGLVLYFFVSFREHGLNIDRKFVTGRAKRPVVVNVSTRIFDAVGTNKAITDGVGYLSESVVVSKSPVYLEGDFCTPACNRLFGGERQRVLRVRGASFLAGHNRNIEFPWQKGLYGLLRRYADFRDFEAAVQIMTRYVPSVSQRNFELGRGVLWSYAELSRDESPYGSTQLLAHQFDLFVSDTSSDYGTYGHDESESSVDDQKNHGPMRRAVRFLFQDVPSTVEAVMLGIIGVFIFRLGFYRDNERFCVMGGVAIFLATILFVVGVSRIIISHI